jgi:hypothetical protein
LKISAKLITEMPEFEKIEKEFDDFVNKHSENPCISSIFLKEGAGLSRFRGWMPLIIVIYSSEKIIGIAPLAIRRKLGLSFAQFLFGPNWLMDFVIDDKYRELCVLQILQILTKTLKCEFIDLTFSEESHTVKPLELACRELGCYFRKEPALFGGHRVVSVVGTWDEFTKARGKKFRAETKRVERKLKELDNWRVTCVEQIKQDPQVCDKILKIDKLSWKEGFLSSQKVAYDPELAVSLNSIAETGKKSAFFKWRVYFLEVKEDAIAYVLVLQSKGTAIINRTSYNSAYKKFSPGMFLLNYTIRELFGDKSIRIIDFRADHPYQKTWATTSISRVDTMNRSGSLLLLIEKLIVKKVIRKRVDQIKQLLFLKHNQNPTIKQVEKNPSLQRLSKES